MELSPVALVQNPAFGAVLLWRFGKAFQVEAVGELAPMPSFFLVLPLLLHLSTLEKIKSTYPSSGLSKLVSKLNENREELVAVHERTLLLRELTFQSLSSGAASRLLSFDYGSGLVRANESEKPIGPEALKHYFSGADKLGRWFARLPQSQVFALLQVEP